MSSSMTRISASNRAERECTLHPGMVAPRRVAGNAAHFELAFWPFR